MNTSLVTKTAKARLLVAVGLSVFLAGMTFTGKGNIKTFMQKVALSRS